ncbi:MAG: response regulator [Syntrophales bacterium]|jgi:HD-like signal output (HDOD) protein|nr:response regulator [Syntrophales bacterium]
MMKKRVLFVDDEPMVLHGLQRMLYACRHEWEMVFVESGAQALEAMALSPFDVIVADMRMPGMNGAELINEVKKRYPQTVRLILSGYSDDALVMQCMGTAHQFIAKPCNPVILKNALQRVSHVSGKLTDPELKKLVANLDRLPSLPVLYTEIMRKLKENHVTIRDIAAIVSRDIGMTAKILQLVNSAFFGLRQRVTNLDNAISFLGLDLIRNLCLTINIFDQYRNIDIPGGFVVTELWNHSLGTACLAQKICRIQNAGKVMEDDAFSAGLLHDAGRLILASNFPEQYRRTILLAGERHCDLFAAEQEVFHHSHCDLGGYLLELWGLPMPVVEAVLLHHEPGRNSASHFSPLSAVHVANVLVQAEAKPAGGIRSSVLDMDYLKSLNMENRVEVWRDVYEKSKTEQHNT